MASTLGKVTVEILSRSNRPLRHFTFDAPERITLGRAYDNDIVIDDPYLCPNHVAIQFELPEADPNPLPPLVTVIDLDSVNGMISDKVKVREQVIQGEEIFTIGRTKFRLLFHPQKLPEAIKLSPFEQVVQTLSHFWPAAVILAMLLLVTGVDHYLALTQLFQWSGLVEDLLGVLFMTALWSGLFSVIARLVGSEVRFWALQSVTALFVIVLNLLGLLYRWLSFNMSFSDDQVWVRATLFFVLSSALFWVSLYLSTKLKGLLRFGLTFLLVGSLTLSIYWEPQMGSFKSVSQASYNHTILPESFLLTPPGDVAAFMAQSATLYERNQVALVKRASEQESSEENNASDAASEPAPENVPEPSPDASPS